MEDMQSLKYIIYARKSTESEDRQVQSIEDQLTRMREIAELRGVRVVDVLTESKSAKAPGQRPQFEYMLSQIERGKADGILCWQINRLSRNPIESGRVQWLLQRGVIRSIVTVEREYRPDDNVLLFSVETGMANQYILDLSRNVKRGMQGKLNRGEYPFRAPVGYLNDRLKKTIVPDPERFSVIKQAWHLILTSGYTIKQIKRKLDESGFRSLKRNHYGAAPVSVSGLYVLFRNPFYAGLIRCNGRLYPALHQPMVTVQEFDEVQRILVASTRLAPKKHFFTYSRLFVCGQCRAAVTAEQRSRRLKDGTLKHHTYYHCTLRKGDKSCTQSRYISEEMLTERIADELERYSILPEFLDFAARALREESHELLELQEAEMRRLHNDAHALKGQLKTLTDLRVKELISEDEFTERRGEIAAELARNEIQLRSTSMPRDVGAECSQVFGDVADVRQRFLDGTMEERRALLVRIGLNRTLVDKIPSIQAKEWFQPIEEFRRYHLGSFERFEREKRAGKTIEKEAFEPLIPSWWATVKAVRNIWSKTHPRSMSHPTSKAA